MTIQLDRATLMDCVRKMRHKAAIIRINGDILRRTGVEEPLECRARILGSMFLEEMAWIFEQDAESVRELSTAEGEP